MSNTISSALSAGTISSTDATALAGALSSIDRSLSSTSAASTSATSRSGLDPSSMKDRIDGLIADQVSSGSLTADQATELKNLFASHGRSTQSADATGDGTGDVAGPDGPPPGPPPGPAPTDAAGSAGSGASVSASASTSTSTSTTDAARTTNDLLSTFIQQLQSGQSGRVGYGASGTANSGAVSALLLDFRS
ncbi:MULTISPECIES: hypothetical protein [Methylobacterium]|nr:MULTISPECIES: hypothetical protein [Methylobacterium]UIN34892.1 hypothetical protein LXM90_28205 [Methylobacterium oryzae]